MQPSTSTAARARWIWLDDVARDVRYSVRSWRRRPAFATVAILTLAVGIGAVTAVFSIVEAVLLRPLPYADADRLVAVWDGHVTERNLAKIFASYADFDMWRRESRTMEQVAALTWAIGDRTLTGYGDPKVVLAIPASVDFFALLGVPALTRPHVRGRRSRPRLHARPRFALLAHLAVGIRHRRPLARARRARVHGRRHHAGRVLVLSRCHRHVDPDHADSRAASPGSLSGRRRLRAPAARGH